MGTHTKNKISMDFASDSSSLDSLSFSGLVIQDQQQKSPSDRGVQNNTDDQEFEFVSGTHGTSHHNLKKNSHPGVIISNNHLLPLEFLLKSAQSQAANKPGYKNSRPASLGSSKTPIDDHANHPELSRRSKNQLKRESTASRSWFGKKLFQSFVSPCRECHADTPTTKAHTMQKKRKVQV